MKTRTISGAVYVALIVGFFLLRQYVNNACFEILIFLLCSIGTFEVASAIKEKTNKAIFFIDSIFGIIFVPLYFTLTFFLSAKNTILVCLCSMLVLCLVNLLIYRFSKDKMNIYKNFLYLVLPIFYPAIFMLSMLLLNGFSAGFIGLLLVFVISALSDTFAYLIGMGWQKIKKGQAKKLCPKLSPKKTVVGALGGILGGILGAVLVYVIFKPTGAHIANVWIYFIFGFVGSIATEIGDLFESLIKRKVGIKDMGKIMPGHGGVMDRIDGITFCSAVICFIIFFINNVL